MADVSQRGATYGLPVQIRIDLDASDPPQGLIRRDDEPAEMFAGWLGLVATLERLLTVPIDERDGASATGRGS